MNQNVPMFLADRARARSAGDHGLERAIQADLDRLGYVEPPERVERSDGMETTAVKPPEQATPKLAPRGRPNGRRKS